MHAVAAEKPPTWYWVVSALLFVWMSVGIMGFGLLLRKGWSTPVLVISFVTVCLQMGYWLLGMPTIELLGPASVPFPIVIIALGGVAVRFSMMAKNRGWFTT